MNEPCNRHLQISLSKVSLSGACLGFPASCFRALHERVVLSANLDVPSGAEIRRFRKSESVWKQEAACLRARERAL